jgi:hypothetical protein
MMGDASDPTIELAERVSSMASELGIATALIGGAALAVHNYVRATPGIDLGTAVDPFRELRLLRLQLDAEGLHTEINLPDAKDPLGGLLRVRWRSDDDERVDLINFQNPLNPSQNPGREAVQAATWLGASESLRCVTLAHLAALKLYAGSRRDQADVIELLRRNPASDRALVREISARYGFARVLEELILEA